MPTPSPRDEAIEGLSEMLSWFEDPAQGAETEAVETLVNLWLADADLAEQIAALPWFADGVTEDEGKAISSVVDVASEDVELAKEVVSLSWLADGVSAAEEATLKKLSSIALEDVEFARTLASLPWFKDRVSRTTDQVLEKLYSVAMQDRELGNQVASFSWVSAYATDVKIDVLYRLSDLASEDVELTRELASVHWLNEGVSRLTDRILSILYFVASKDRELGRHMMLLPWMDNNLGYAEFDTLQNFRLLASADVELAKKTANLAWFADPDVTEEERGVVGILYEIADKDVELARDIAALPWMGEDSAPDKRTALSDFSWIYRIDPGLANDIAGFAWFVDDLTDGEKMVIGALARVASKDVEIARKVAGLVWFIDGVTKDEAGAIEGLGVLFNTDVELARDVAALAWFIDGVTQYEKDALVFLPKHIGFAKEVAALQWFIDGITKLESSALHSVDGIASKDLEIARSIINWPRYQDGVVRDLDFFLLYALSKMDSELIEELKAQSWFDDGLSNEEAALVVTLPGKLPEMQKDLLDVNLVFRQSITLPLTGEINVWIIQIGDPAPNKRILSEIRHTLLIAEELFAAPVPTTDVILLVSAQKWTDRPYDGQHYGSHMVARSHEGEVHSIPHETAHYYLTANFGGHRWFIEGGANFVEALFYEWQGSQELADRRSGVYEYVQTRCIDRGMENIRHNAYLVERDLISFYACTYEMGESLLLKLLKILGEMAMASALNELYVASGGHVPALKFSTPPTEQEIFMTFLKHTPEGRRDEVRELFRRLHGGDFAFPEIDKEDGEANDPDKATLIEVGELVEGTLDYIFDFDFFRFQAQKGQRYRIGVDHKNLGHTSITVYAPDGETEERERWKSRGKGTDGPLILWRAPRSGEHYFAVQNFGGKTGGYTFIISPVDVPDEDDHGDTPESATQIRLGRLVSGKIDHPFDYDYLTFDVRQGREYAFEFYEGSFNILCAEVLARDDSIDPDWYNDCDESGRENYAETFGHHWIAPETGKYYLALYGYGDRVGEYEFKIVIVN